VLDEEQVDPSRVLLAHSGDTTDADHLTELAEAGFLLGMDRMGINLEMSFEDRVGIVVEMCERGLRRQHGAGAGRLLLHRLDPARPHAAAADWHYLHVQKDVVPRCSSAASRRSRSTRCWSATRAATSRLTRSGRPSG
jgi:phosphotriesterase-related protein